MIEADNSQVLSTDIFDVEVSTNTDLHDIYLQPTSLLTKPFESSDTILTVDDATDITVSGINNFYIDIDGEEMLFKSKTCNKVTVERGQDGTTIANHVKGAAIKSITTADNALVQEGDDFGFSGTTI